MSGLIPETLGERTGAAVVSSCLDQGVPIRVGVNAGSLEKDLQKSTTNPRRIGRVSHAHIDILVRLISKFKEVSSDEILTTVCIYFKSKLGNRTFRDHEAGRCSGMTSFRT